MPSSTIGSSAHIGPPYAAITMKGDSVLPFAGVSSLCRPGREMADRAEWKAAMLDKGWS